jgi:hypothetical protein
MTRFLIILAVLALVGSLFSGCGGGNDCDDAQLCCVAESGDLCGEPVDPDAPPYCPDPETFVGPLPAECFADEAGQ